MDNIEKVDTLEKTWVSRIADEELLRCAWDVQNCHGLGLVETTPRTFHRRRTARDGSSQPIP